MLGNNIAFRKSVRTVSFCSVVLIKYVFVVCAFCGSHCHASGYCCFLWHVAWQMGTDFRRSLHLLSSGFKSKWSMKKMVQLWKKWFRLCFPTSHWFMHELSCLYVFSLLRLHVYAEGGGSRFLLNIGIYLRSTQHCSREYILILFTSSCRITFNCFWCENMNDMEQCE